MVSASQITNTLGAQVVFDGNVPRTFTARALETISGGFLVQISGATGDVGSQISSYADGDLKVIGAQTAALCNGVALQNAGSNELVTVATRGAYLMNAGEIVSGGALVGHNGSGAVLNWKGHVSGTALINETFIGRALTTSASGTSNYALISLNL
jgi:hypothetical protein